ncbi:MAG: hypothetical protein MJ010_00455 [Paludibacteraceae bacterium]|nr:hypothetical protein [Paludibacteraceae bacterium]
MPKLKKGDIVYRVYGSKSQYNGASWTTVNPEHLPNYRSLAGLPDDNTGEFLIKCKVINPAKCIEVRPALPLDGNPGGLIEYVIPDPFSSGALQIFDANSVRVMSIPF